MVVAAVVSFSEVVGLESVGDNYSHLSGAEDLGQRVGPHPGTRRDGGTGLSEGLCGLVGVDEHFRYGHRPTGVFF